MAKKKIEIKKDYLDAIINDQYTITYSKQLVQKNLEEDVDDKVKELLRPIWGKNLTAKKTGNKAIDSLIPAFHGDTGSGKPDIMIYDYLNHKEISLIIENKNFTSMEDALQQAITYASVGNAIKKPVRIVIGNSPGKKLEVRVLVRDKYEPLSINGKVVDYFFGKHILKLIYDNPNINEFILVELVEKNFTQKDFQNIINKLKTLYRQIPEIQNNDDLSINFSVAFVALKMIMEKQNIQWSAITTPDDIRAQVDNIIGKKALKILKEKYRDIFIMTDNDGNITFNFYDILTNIDVRENNEDIDPADSVLIEVHNYLKSIPDKDLSIDLFGEVYECLASKKTKSLLGEYFTRRHIIHAIVQMFLTEDDIESIVEYKKLIGDPACGTGGFLTESFKYIKEYCSKAKSDTDITNLASEIIVGYDINNNSIGRTRINMILAGDGFSDIQRLNTLTSSQAKKNLDYILTNIPYGKGDFAISDANSKDEFLKSNNNKRLELNFAIKIVQMLKNGGKASLIVPEGLLEAPTLAPFREWLLKQCKLKTVISLPKFAFAPYTKWKTYVIFIEKRQTPLTSISEVIKKNEKTWAYIVDNDGFANSDKRFSTSLKDKCGAWLHDELQPYIDNDGIKQSSKIVEAYESEYEDETKLYYNEWNKEIKGKKCGFISIKDLTQKKVIKYKTLTALDVNSIIKNEANKKTILSDETYEVLVNMLGKGKNGYSVKKEFYIDNGELKDEYIPIFEELHITFDAENGKYYDIGCEDVIYALPMIPEKYFRRKETTSITLDSLIAAVNEIEHELKQLFGGTVDEDK